MKKFLSLLCVLASFTSFSQVSQTIFATEVNLIYKSGDNFETSFLQFTEVALLPSASLKNRMFGSSEYKRIGPPNKQIELAKYLVLEKIKVANFEERLSRLNLLLSAANSKLYEIGIDNNQLVSIVSFKAKGHGGIILVDQSMELGVANSWDTWYEKAQKLYAAKNYTGAAQAIDEALKLRADISELYNLKSFILFNQKKYSEVIATTTKGIALSPNNGRFYFLRAASHYLNFEPNLAILDYRASLNFTTYNARYYRNFLQVLNEQQLDEEMIKVYNSFAKAMQSGQQFDDKEQISEVYFYASLAYTRSKQNDKVIELLNRAIAFADTPNSDFYSNRRLAYNKFKNWTKALQDINKAISIEPNSANMYMNRYAIYFNSEDYENARKDLLKSLSMTGGNVSIYIGLGNVYQNQGKAALAVENFELALKTKPNDVTLISNAAYANFENDAKRKAFDQWTKASGLAPDEIDVLIGLAVSYFDQENLGMCSRTLNLNEKRTEYRVDEKLLKELKNGEYNYTRKFQEAWLAMFRDE